MGSFAEQLMNGVSRMVILRSRSEGSVDHGKEICFPSGMEKMGPVIQKLYDTLTGIQMGRIQAPEGWLKVIE